MSKPNEPGPDGKTQRGARWAATTVVALAAGSCLLLQLPLGATAAFALSDDDVALTHTAPPAPLRKSTESFRLRCWQYGQLLFDEGPVTLGAEVRQGARLVAVDRNGGALIVTDAGRTTCLARPYPPAPSLALPR